MTTKVEVALLKSLPLEERAKMCKKDESSMLSFWAMICIILIGILVGLYYWFIDDIIFTYDYVHPFWGFILLVLIGVFLGLFFFFRSIDKIAMKEYNPVIFAANNELLSNIYNGHGTPEQFEIIISSCRERGTVLSHSLLSCIKDGNITSQQRDRLKVAYVESQIGSDRFKQTDYEWHTQRICWGCGKEHKVTPKVFTVFEKKTQTWKKGAERYWQDFGVSADILLCPECYERLSDTQKHDDKFAQIMENTYNITGYILTIGVFVVNVIAEITNGTETNRFFSILGVIIPSVLCWGIFFNRLLPVGRIVFAPIWIMASIIDKLIWKKDGTTKWDFSDIPQLRLFRKKDQRR